MNTRTTLTPYLRLVTPQTGRNEQERELIGIRDYAAEVLGRVQSLDATDPFALACAAGSMRIALQNIREYAHNAVSLDALPGLDDLNDDYTGDFGGAA